VTDLDAIRERLAEPPAAQDELLETGRLHRAATEDPFPPDLGIAIQMATDLRIARADIATLLDALDDRDAEIGLLRRDVADAVQTLIRGLQAANNPTRRTVRDEHEVRQAIRDAVKADGKFYIQLAKHLGITQKHLSQIMAGRNGLSLPLLFATLSYLGLTLELRPTPEENR
jgi:hypothetical protein